MVECRNETPTKRRRRVNATQCSARRFCQQLQILQVHTFRLKEKARPAAVTSSSQEVLPASRASSVSCASRLSALRHVPSQRFESAKVQRFEGFQQEIPSSVTICDIDLQGVV